MNFYKFKKALVKSWGKETAYHKDAPNWTIENPALGQCAITALLFNEYFGGKIFSGVSETGIVHYWNKIFGFKVDLTKQQFKSNLVFKNIVEWNRSDLLESGNVAERYDILKQRMLENYETL